VVVGAELDKEVEDMHILEVDTDMGMGTGMDTALKALLQ